MLLACRDSTLAHEQVPMGHRVRDVPTFQFVSSVTAEVTCQHTAIVGKEARMAFRGMLALACLLLALPVAAQQTTGALEGRVTDASGAVMPGVTVTLAGPALPGGVQATISSDEGSWRIPNIPLGTYTLTFELDGFSKRVYDAIRVQTHQPSR